MKDLVRKPAFIIAVLVVLVILAALLGMRLERHETAGEVALARMGAIDWWIAANGRTEGVSEEIELSSKIPGRLKSILAEEGDSVKAGQVVAVLENNDYRAQVEVAQAALDKAQAQLELVLNGARQEERDVAKATMEEARVIAENAHLAFERIERLYQSGGVVSRDDFERAERDWKAAEARFEAARQTYNLVDAPPRPEKLAAAQADAALARARLREARANYENTFVRSPIDAVVLKTFMKAGESITFQTVSMPIISIADDSEVMVRAEIDETDIAKVQRGQSATITVDAFKDEVFAGRIVRLGRAMGRKKISSPDPTEKADVEVLEALIELESPAGKKLILGLRVDVAIHLARAENVLVVPRRAVFTEGGKSFVKVKNENRWVDREVRTGLRDEMHIQIRQGLSRGDGVLINPNSVGS